MVQRLSSALVLASLLVACSPRGTTCARPDACGARATDGPCARPTLRRAPVHAPRDACLTGEWAPPPAEAPELAGLAHGRGTNDREHILTRPGARPWTSEEIQTFRTAHERDLFALGGIEGAGSGLYCGSTTGTMLSIELTMCHVRLGELAAWLRERLDASLPTDAEATICISLGGLAGPRCDPEAGACDPVPYTGELARIGYSCERDRFAIAWTERGLSRGECAHDGECVQAGCGNHCVAWPEGGFAATCEGYSDLEGYPALCGCVEGRCTWFRL